MKPAGEYRKHIYWLTEEEAVVLQGTLQGAGTRVMIPKGVVCTSMDERSRIAIVPPRVWSETCSRPGSWYRASDRNGLYLVVSPVELEAIEERKAGMITRSDFLLPPAANSGQKEDLIRDPEFASKIPEDWMSVGDKEKRIYLRWAARLGSNVRDFSFLFLTQTANHANFIKPRFFIEENGMAIPYSIDLSAHVCSCCLEIFQVLGREHRRKLVVPCPGAVLFARLEPNRCLLVERP